LEEEQEALADRRRAAHCAQQLELRSPGDQEAQKIKLQNPYSICGGEGSLWTLLTV
jgi:hypothetical protein